jgi:8-oxo-dGTP pyrophosphatase MutT (NUDIX family)
MDDLLFVGEWSRGQVQSRIIGSVYPPDQCSGFLSDAWRKYQQRHPLSFDGTLLSLKGYTADSGSLIFSLARVPFSWYIATRDPKFSSHYPQVKRADPVGLTAIIVTSDNGVVIGRRAATADPNPGAIYYVGGMADSGDVDENGSIDLFKAIRREIREEINLEIGLNEPAKIVGMAYDPLYCHPEIFFLLPISLTSKQISEIICNVDRSEFSHLSIFSSAEYESCCLDAQPKTWSFHVGYHLVAPYLKLMPSKGIQ